MISIIIPTFNEEKYLGRLLDSIKFQSLSPLEIIVADNNSPDDTRKIAKKYGCKVVGGGNPAVGRNSGAKVARGELLLFLDSDVLLSDEDFLKRLSEKFERKSADVAVCYFVSEEAGLFLRFQKLFVNMSKKFQEFMSRYLGLMFGDYGTFILIKKNVYEDVGGFDEDLIALEDVDFFQKLQKKGYSYRVLNEKVVVSARRIHAVGAFSYVGLLAYILKCSIYGLFGLRFPDKTQKKYLLVKGEMGGGRG